MHLIHLLILRGLFYNFRVFAVYVWMKENDLSDSLSRLQFDRFCKLTEGTPRVNSKASELPPELWPASKIWDGFKGDW